MYQGVGAFGGDEPVGSPWSPKKDKGEDSETLKPNHVEGQQLNFRASTGAAEEFSCVFLNPYCFSQIFVNFRPTKAMFDDKLRERGPDSLHTT